MKKHIKKFEGFRTVKAEVNPINETVYQVEDLFRVNIIVDVPMKVLSAYSKKVEQNTQKKLVDLMGNAMLAEELVKYVIKEGLDADKIPATAIIGGAQGQSQSQGGQAQVQVQPVAQSPQDQAQVQPVQGQGAPQSQSQEGFEDVKQEDLPI
jgi:23S rRNA pseudoU1915 N3-methylase RlmH